MRSAKNRCIEFGPFRIEIAARALWRDEEIVPLTPKSFDTLLALVERRGEIAGRDELIRAVWPDTFVESGNLNSNIFTLRRALGDSRQQYIATVPRRGYRFIAEVKEVSALDQPDCRTVPGSIVVLPLKSLSDDESDRNLGIGIADALITRFSRLRQIIVRPTGAARKYMLGDVDALAAGRELCAQWVLEGSIRRQDETVRITMQLISVAEDATVWAEKFDEKPDDIFAIEDRISDLVASTLTLHLPIVETKSASATMK